MEYADLLTAVQAGQIVAVAPSVNECGEPSLVIVTGYLPPLHQERLATATVQQRARIAVRAVREVREHYGI